MHNEYNYKTQSHPLFKMNFHLDMKTVRVNVPVLCIPRVYSNISESRIRRVFDDLDLGVLERIDIVNKKNDKGEKFNRVFVHFKHWSDNKNANIARERLMNGKEIKVLYDDPWFWKISAYRPPNPNGRRNKKLAKATLHFDSEEEDIDKHVVIKEEKI